MENNKKVAERFDWGLSFLLLLFFLVSCVAIYSGQTSGQYEGKNFLLQQIFWYAVGAVIISIVMYFDSDQLKKLLGYYTGLVFLSYSF